MNKPPPIPHRFRNEAPIPSDGVFRTAPPRPT
jgi:hypothetical protein